MTVSAYIIHDDDGEWKCLVHMHKKIDKLMQIGGHIELTQTPWQALAAELSEETGYRLDDLKLLQPSAALTSVTDAVVHPVPFLENTHDVGGGHYHSDRCYAFIATDFVKSNAAKGESADLRWLSLGELELEGANGTALQDTTDIYRYLLENMDSYNLVDPTAFSLSKPTKGITYKR